MKTLKVEEWLFKLVQGSFHLHFFSFTPLFNFFIFLSTTTLICIIIKKCECDCIYFS